MDRCSSDSCTAAVMGYSSTIIQPACLTEATFDIRVTLSDHTGSISRCVIGGPVAEKILGITVKSFLARDSIYAIARYMPSSVRPSVRLSGRLSITRVDQSKTVDVRITQPSPQSSPMTLVS